MAVPSAPASALLLLGFTAFSCSSDSGSPGSGATSGDYKAFTQQFAARYCELAASCCQQVGITADQLSCELSVAFVLGEDARSLTSGRGAFDADVAAQCLAALPVFLSGCSPPSDKPELCARVIRGSVAPGGVCGWSTDCEAPESGSAYCAIESWQEPLEGTCVARPPSTVGSSCAYGQCDDDPTLYCAVSDGLCAPKLAQGELCSMDAPCGEGLVCRSDGSAAYSCEPPSPLGSDCSSGDCAPGMYCASGKCAPQKQPGEPCTEAFFECVSACLPSAGVCEPLEPHNISCFAD
jgi:hypothetical protein